MLDGMRKVNKSYPLLITKVCFIPIELRCSSGSWKNQANDIFDNVCGGSVKSKKHSKITLLSSIHKTKENTDG